MQYILSLLPALACPVGMGLMAWLMIRGNKQQAPSEVDQARTPEPHQPLKSAELPAMEVPSRSASAFNLLGMCLNWKALLALAGVEVFILMLAPRFFWTALPILLVAACPLSMLLMMRGMSGKATANASQPSQMRREPMPAGEMADDEQVAVLPSRLSDRRTGQEDLAVPLERDQM